MLSGVVSDVGERDRSINPPESSLYMKTLLSVTLAPSKSGYDKLMIGFVASVISRHLPCNWMPDCPYFTILSLKSIVSGSVL